MNIITFKGIPSTTYTSIEVQELPPIIKPRQRTNQYYIDGRSGAQVEKLGYESYPKTAKLGFKSLDDIDSILAWIDGAGDVIFSNEPNKVYRGQIIEQIDIIRIGGSFYQSDTVTWLVYPYKYLLDEAGVDLEANTVTAITNAGNTDSLPLIDIEATSPTTIYINDVAVCTVDTSYTNYDISVDSDNGGLTYFRTSKLIIPGIVTGTFPILSSGANTIKLTSDGLISAKVYARSRFL